MINKWLTKHYDEILTSVKKIEVKDKDDILQQTFLYFLEMNRSKTERLIKENNAVSYIVAMFKINAYFKTSPYQQKFNKHKFVKLYDIYTYDESEHEDSKCLADLHYLVNDLKVFFVDKLLFKSYVSKKLNGVYGIRKLATDLNMSEANLRKKIKDIKNIIKENYK